MFSVNFAERGEVGEIRGTVGDVYDHAADVVGLATRRPHHFDHAAQRAVPLRHEIADGDDLTGDEQYAAAFLGQHAVIPAAGSSAKDFRIDDLKRHVAPQPVIVMALPLGRWPCGSHNLKIASATSSGVMSRCCPAEPSMAVSASAGALPVFATTRATDSFVISVSTNPGQTALHVTLVPSSSAATLRVKPTTACFAAA